MRDALADPFGRAPATPEAPPEPDEPDDDTEEPEQRSLRVTRFASILKQKADARDRRVA